MSQTVQVFSVHDSKAEAFIQPFYAPTVGVACRMFEQACNDETSDFNKYAGDYTLFHLGEFDQDSASFNIHQAPVNLGLAITFINQEQ